MLFFFLICTLVNVLVTLSRGLVLLRRGPYQRLRGDNYGALQMHYFIIIVIIIIIIIIIIIPCSMVP